MVKYDLNLLKHPFGTSNVVRRGFVGFIPAVNGGAFSSHLRNVSPTIIDQHYDVRSEEDKMKQRQEVLNDVDGCGSSYT